MMPHRGSSEIDKLTLKNRVQKFVENKKLIKPPSADFPIYTMLKCFENKEGFVPLGPMEKEFYDKQHDDLKFLPIGTKFYKLVRGQLRSKFSTDLHLGLKTLNKKIKNLVNCSDFGTYCVRETITNFGKWREVCEEDKQRRIKALYSQPPRTNMNKPESNRLCRTFHAQDYKEESNIIRGPGTAMGFKEAMHRPNSRANLIQREKSALRDTFQGHTTMNSSGFSENISNARRNQKRYVVTNRVQKSENDHTINTLLGITAFSYPREPRQHEGQIINKKLNDQVKSYLQTANIIKTDVEDIKQRMAKLIRKRQRNPRKKELARLRIVNESLNYSQYTKDYPQDFVSAIRDMNSVINDAREEQ